MQTDEEAIREVISRWHRATAEGDVDTVLGLMSEDVVFLVPGHPPMRGRAAFEKGLRGLLSQQHVESTGDPEEIAVAGQLAYTITQLNVGLRPRDGGPAKLRQGRTLSIFRKQSDGRWQLIRDANLLPPGG